MASNYRVPAHGDSATSTPEPSVQKSSGCQVSVVHGFILLLLAMAIAVGVGVIVYFAGGRDIICQCGDTPRTTSVTSQALEQQCIAKISNGEGQTMCDVCNAHTESTSAAHSTPAPTEEPRDYRLPITVRPYHYAAELQPNIYDGENGVFDFEGKVRIATNAEKAEDTIILHANKTINVTESSLRVVNVNTSSQVTVTHTSYEEVREFFTIHLSQTLVVGQHYEISMEFRAPLAKNGRGLSVTHYEENGKKIYLVATHLEAVSARKVFPCFDEPALKAEFDITLVRQSGGERNYTSLSNTQSLRTEPRGNGMVADIYERTVVMSTYLLAFIVCDYTYLETNTSNILYRTWAMPQRIQFASKAQEYGVEIFDKFAEYFKPVYPLSKLDNIGIPNFRPGAMENWGLIIYRTKLFYEPGMSTASDENWMAEVISHEIAHQWFGNLVSPKWWNWLWLNEAFASFWDYHIVGEIYPDWRKLDMNVVLSVHGAMETDSVMTSHPMSADPDSTQSPSQISKLFDGITYRKGSAVIRMMHLAMGQELFIKGLNRYLRTHAFGNAEHQDLWDALTEEARVNSVDLDMTEIMDPWVTQMNFPVVEVIVGSGKVTLKQHRFLKSEEGNVNKDAGKYGYKWTIPITYTVSNSPNFTTEYIYSNVHYMKYSDNEMVLNVNVPPGGWIIVNLQQCGFFRVNYDVTTWNNIINFLENDDHDVIDPINRAQIINDAWNLAKAGELDMAIALNTVNFLSKDPDYVPWRAFRRELGYVDDMLEQTAIYGTFKQFMNSAVTIPFTTLGTTIAENMIPFKRIEISTMVSIACEYDLNTCVDGAVNSFTTWMNNPSINPIAPDLRSTYYCTALRHGGLPEWTFVYDQYHLAVHTSEKNRLRDSLACTREPWLLQRILEMSVDTAEFPTDELDNVIISVANNHWGRELAWNYLIFNLDHISSLVAESAVKSLVLGVTKKFNTQQELQKLDLFMNSGVDYSAAGTGFAEAVNKTQTNIDWMKKNYHAISTWLTSQ